jgi:BsuBI/PstI restriction endonuclease HTH domain
MTHVNTGDALKILGSLGVPQAQLNERSALTLLALLDLRPNMQWSEATRPLMGITPIMSWMERHYDKKYAPNSRETVRRFTMHQFVAAGIAVYNPDAPLRPVNSPKAVYQISPPALVLLRTYGGKEWDAALADYLMKWKTLVARFN